MEYAKLAAPAIMAVVLALALWELFFARNVPSGDIFEVIWKQLLKEESIVGATTVQVKPFITALQRHDRSGRSSEVLQLMSLLGGEKGDAEKGEEKPLERGRGEAMQKLFKQIDANGDGEITWAEWSRWVAMRRSQLARSVYDEVKAEVEAGGASTAPGDPSGVPANLFVAALVSKPLLMQLFNVNGSSKSIIGTLDANGDGVITWDEFRAVAAKVQGAETTRRQSSAGVAEAVAKKVD